MDPTYLIIAGLAVGSCGPIVIVVGNNTGLWKRFGDAATYDQLATAKRTLAMQGSINPTDTGFAVLCSLLTDHPPQTIERIRLASSGWNELAGHVEVHTNTPDQTKPTKIGRSHGVFLALQDELHRISDAGRATLLHIGLLFILIGFLIQGIGVAIDAGLL